MVRILSVSEAWQAALARPERPMLVSRAGALNVGQVDELSRRAMTWLQGRGLSGGHRVAIRCAPTEEVVVLLHAAARLGVCAVLLHPAMSAAGLGAARGMSEGGQLVDLGQEPDFPGALLSSPPMERLPEPAPDADAAVIFSSGSTGPARGVRLSWQALAGSLGRFQRAPDRPALPEERRELIAGLLHTITGYRGVVLAPLVRASTALMVPPESTVLQLLADCAALEADLLYAGPAFVAAALAAPALPKPSALRGISVGGAALLPGERQALADRLNVPILHSYGLTETAGMVAVMSARPGDAPRPGMGRPVLPVRIVDARGEPTAGEGWIEVMPEVPVSADARGGPAADAQREEWVRSGDLGWLDEAGWLHVRGRAARLHTAPTGEKVLLEDLEAQIRAALGVEAIVCSLPLGGRSPQLAALVQGIQLSEAWILRARAQLSRALPPHALPQRWRSCPELPRLPGGKPDLGAAARALSD